MINEKKLKKILKEIPPSPGIYKMLTEDGGVIYIGKAKDLSKRIRQYFQKNYEHSSRTKKLLEKIADISYTAVDSELEANILETNLIKQFQPKYNVIMKDDKNYVYIKITQNEPFPRIQIVRNVEKDGAKYFGPKSSAHKVKETFKLLKKIFPFRHCGLNITEKGEVTKKTIKYPCIDYYIKRCAAPCIGKITKEEYAKIITNIENFLKGKADGILEDQKKTMMQLAKDKQFEKAARLRDKIDKITDILEKQKVSTPNQEDSDIINYCISHDKSFFNLFQIRDGKLIGQENFILTAKDVDQEADREVLSAFIQQYYSLATDIPKTILVPHTPEDKKNLESSIKKEAQRTIAIKTPQKGDKNKLLEMSLNNARIFADRNRASWQTESEDTKKAAEELQKLLKIKEPLKRVECYDISHLSGTDTVGSMVVFENGAPKNSLYRKFKLRTIDAKPDDYKSMEEVLIRRFTKISTEIAQQSYVFKKARKKDSDYIKKRNPQIDLTKTDRSFFIIEKDKKTRGFIGVKQYNDKIAELTNLFVTTPERGNRLGYKLIKNTITKTKAKRFYIICKTPLKEYYELLGFEEIKKIPDELTAHCKECKIRHGDTTTLAIDKLKLKEDESFSKIPNLVVIDGGKGQLSVATKVFKQLNLKIPYIALSKQLEEIHTPQSTKKSNTKSRPSIILPRNNEALKLLQRARDEAHRFAISYNRKLRSKRITKK